MKGAAGEAETAFCAARGIITIERGSHLAHRSFDRVRADSRCACRTRIIARLRSHSCRRFACFRRASAAGSSSRSAVSSALGAPAHAHRGRAAAPRSRTRRSTRALFYQLLIGEIELRDGRSRHGLPGGARRRTPHQERADVPARDRCRAAGACRRTGARRGARLARRGAGIGRSAALPGAVAGRAEPRRPKARSRSAALLRLTPRPSVPAMIDRHCRASSRAAADRKARPSCSAQALRPYLDDAGTGRGARRRRPRAGSARSTHAQALDSRAAPAHADPTAEAPALLALEMLPARRAPKRSSADYLRPSPTTPTCAALRAQPRRHRSATPRRPSSSSR